MPSRTSEEESAGRRKPIVAIDGPVASGKSTVARMVADRLGFAYLDTGAMYRAVGVLAQAAGSSPDDETAIAELAGSLDFRFHSEPGKAQRLLVNRQDLTRAIRTQQADEWSALVGGLAQVKQVLVEAQRKIVAGGQSSAVSNGWVVEGRDMQTVVFPDAEVKVFLTASAEERARRRLKDIEDRGEKASLADVIRNIEQRDHGDRTRAVAPLKKAPDASEVCTDGLSIEEVVERVVSIAQARISARRASRTSAPHSSSLIPHIHAWHPLYYLGRAFFRAIFRLMGRWRICGKENVPPSGGLILAPNHVSYVDPPLAGSAIGRKVWFMAKSELFKIPILGLILPRVCAFPVKRGRPDRQALRAALQLLSAGQVVTIFPEGTRSPDGELQKPELGVALLALRSGAPVLPMALIGSDRLLPQHSPIPRFAKVTVRIGRPLHFSQEDSPSRETMERVAGEVMCSLASLLAQGH